MTTMIVAVTLVITLVLGIVYAWYISTRPMPVGWTWLSVVIGCGFTNAAISVILWDICGGWLPVVMVWGCYVLTGAPMIIGVVIRHQQQMAEACDFAARRAR